jgi:UDP-N-acetylglucosamine 2-epimerase (non-hydrolysing)
VDHISDINMTHTEHARRYLLLEGIRPETVIKTGSPMKEVLTYYKPKIDKSEILAALGLAPQGYLVVSAHREENIDSDTNFSDLMDTLKAMAARYRKPIIVSTHPRTRKRLAEAGITELAEGVRFLKPLGFFDYVKLQLGAFCVVSDSGTITEESSILDFSAVTIRQAHERPEGMDVGTLIMCGLKAPRVLEAIEVVTSQHAAGERRFPLVPDYDVDNVSGKVLRIILSYIEYVNRTVWQKI